MSFRQRASDVTAGRPIVIRPEYQHVATTLALSARRLQEARGKLAEALRLLQELLDEDRNGTDVVLRRRAQRMLEEQLRYLRETRPR